MVARKISLSVCVVSDCLYSNLQALQILPVSLLRHSLPMNVSLQECVRTMLSVGMEMIVRLIAAIKIFVSILLRHWIVLARQKEELQENAILLVYVSL